MNSQISNPLIEIFGTRIDMVQIPEVLGRMERWIAAKERGRYISVTNATSLAISRRRNAFKEAVNSSSFSVPDGISLVLLAKLYGFSLKKRVYGPELMLEFLKIAEEKGYSNFFYGYNPENLGLLIHSLRKRFPRLKIAGSCASIFGAKITSQEDNSIIEAINAVNPDMLWVGLGCPQQEFWMHEHHDKVNVPVMAGVGAAFDFLAGIKPQAPKWVRNNGFEWLFRLTCEPRRLWRRYLVDGSGFACHATVELIKYKCKGKVLRNV
jgi:N-acetylglucosaminyldiphosphoundecaprenol N-acetyl-beta-D-mannosaminyltransferase